MRKDDQNQLGRLKKNVRLDSDHGTSSDGENPEENPEKQSPYSITEEELQKRLVTTADTGRKTTQIYACLVGKQLKIELVAHKYCIPKIK